MNIAAPPKQPQLPAYNVVVSSWPSAGGSTTSMILSIILNLRYIYAGGVLKDWAKRMDFDPKTNELHEWEHKYGGDWDDIWEAYILKKLSLESGILSEGKTAGFLLPEGRAYEVMIYASPEVRAKRAGGDGRTEDILKRDALLKDRWTKSFAVDIFDFDSIKANYDKQIDNSELSISECVIEILNGLRIYIKQNNNEADLVIDNNWIRTLEKEYWRASDLGQNPKKDLQSYLKNKGLYISNEEIFNDLRIIMSEKYLRLPKEMQV